MPHSLPRRAALLLLATLALPGCNGTGGVPADFDYASTSLGLRNSGLLEPGQLFLLDLSTATLLNLQETVPLAAPGSVQPPATLVASNVSGVSFGATAEGGAVSADAKAAFERSLSFRVEDAQRVGHSDVITAVSSAYARDPDGNRERWHIADLVGNPGRYRLVVLVNPTFARKEAIEFVSSVDVGGSGRFRTVKIGDTSFKVDTRSAARCEAASDARVICFVGATLMRASLVERDGEKLVRFAIDGVGKDVLPAAFRSLS
jgi:hypothetical protein